MRVLGKFALETALCVIAACCLVYSLGHNSTSAQPLPQNEWSQVKVPTAGESRVVGFYSSGCIAGAKALPLNGTGFQVMRPNRNRYYGHANTIQFVKNLAQQMRAVGSGLLIGDMAQPRGGPLPYGHTSHQLGLDVDIWFWTHPEQNSRILTANERETLPFVSMLNSNGAVDTTKFTHEQILKLKTAALDPAIQRIFVNAAIKIYLCSTLDHHENAWLHKLRPWPGHDEHFHARLFCPKEDLECVTQDPVPEGDGCADAMIPAPEPSPSTDSGTSPVLPSACQTILRAPAGESINGT